MPIFAGFQPEVVVTHILVVENDPKMRHDLCQLLRQRWIVDAVPDGLAALETALRNTPDLVLTNLMAPGMDGIQLARRLRDSEKTREIPIILLSADACEEAKLAGLESGVDDYLLKPFSARELLARVENHLRLGQLCRGALKRERELWAETVNILESTNDVFMALDSAWRITYVNAAAERTHARPRESLLGETFWEAFPDTLGGSVEQAFRQSMAQRVAIKFEIFYEPYGEWFEIDTFPVIHGGTAFYAPSITERKRVEQALQEKDARIRRLVDSNIIGVIFWELGGAITEANDAFLELVGYSRQDLLAGKIQWADMTPPEYRALDEKAVEQLMRTGVCPPLEKEYIRKDGRRVPVLLSRALFEGSREQGVGFVLDLTARKEAEVQMRHLADHDALTGLPNRALVQDRMQQAVASAHRNARQVAILFIDLDYFKNINTSLGHQIGDVLLQMAAQRLQQWLREGDSVARLGGDEFVLILPELSDSDDAARVAEKVLDALAQPFIVGDQHLHISASIGISLYPDDGSDVETLMRTADTAMYHAKESGRDNYKFFTAALNQAVQQRMKLSTRLRRALVNDEFVLHYQPQVDMESGAIFSVEALLRWQPAGKEAISCGNFIANAEESGLIVPMGEWALRESCRQLKIWHAAGYPHLKMAVNLSPRQLEQAGFCQLVGQILDEAGIPSGDLELEITEGILLERNEAVLATLTQFSDMGIQLSVDDFGTGYSSLSYLQRFPVHALKIDQSFVRDIGTDSKDTALVTAIIAMANSLDLKVIAEGVETLHQAQFLMSHGCQTGQGFYYGKAQPAGMLPELFRIHPLLQGSMSGGTHSGSDSYHH